MPPSRDEVHISGVGGRGFAVPVGSVIDDLGSDALFASPTPLPQWGPSEKAFSAKDHASLARVALTSCCFFLLSQSIATENIFSILSMDSFWQSPPYETHDITQ